MKALQIFRPGRHTSSDGRVLTFTEAQLKACAAAYDPALHEAPLVIGHPRADAPAYGWAKSLVFGETLEAEPHQVDAQFAEMVNQGRFKKISASFWLADAPGNPKPGTLYLRHIGFLGAQPPAVKGLKSASFADGEQGVIEFMDWTQRDIASLFRGLRDWMIGKFGKDEADKVIPSYMVDSIQEEAVKDTTTTAAYTEQPQETDVLTKEQLEERERVLKADQAKLAQERVEFAERDKKLRDNETAQQRAQRQRECAAFVDAQVREGRVLPASRDGLVAFMAALPSDGVVEFGEGDKAVKKPSGEWLRGYITGLPAFVEFKERGQGTVTTNTLPSDPQKAGQEIAKRAVEFQETEKKAGRIISIDVAVQHVTQGEQR